MDGFFSAELIKKAIEKDAVQYDVDYTFDYKDLYKQPKNNNLYITDYSFKPDVMEKLIDYFDAVIWIDHHTVIEDPLYEKFKNLEGLRRIGHCGAKLTLEYIYKSIGVSNLPDFNSSIDKIINIVDAYDCWKENSEFYDMGCLLNNYFYSIEPTLEKLIEEMESGFKNSRLLNDASIIKRSRICKQKSYEIMIDFGTGIESCWLVMEGVKGSLNFKAKYDNKIHNGMIAYSYLPKAKLWEVSLYSTHSYVDCSVIAKSLGGGGHKGASGFQATTEKMLELKIF